LVFFLLCQLAERHTFSAAQSLYRPLHTALNNQPQGGLITRKGSSDVRVARRNNDGGFFDFFRRRHSDNSRRRIAFPGLRTTPKSARNAAIKSGNYDRRNGVQWSVCGAAIQSRACLLRVKSRNIQSGHKKSASPFEAGIPAR
jgi:hypothetical protein